MNPTEVFERERPRLVGLAYRLLGSLADAEDVVQEAWLRWRRTEADAVEVPAAWLTTVTSRLGVDRLRQRQRERARYVGPWLPEPVVTSLPPDRDQPEAAAELADSLALAFLTVLETLRPSERLAFLLAEVFRVPYAEVATTLDTSEQNARQLVSRARRKLAAAETPARVPTSDRRRVDDLTSRFFAAVIAGDLGAAAELMTPDVVLVSDGGAAAHAARRPVVGPARVARLLVNLVPRLPEGAVFEPVELNGEPAVLVRVDGAPFAVQQLQFDGDRISRMLIVINPEKLTRLDSPPSLC